MTKAERLDNLITLIMDAREPTEYLYSIVIDTLADVLGWRVDGSEYSRWAFRAITHCRGGYIQTAMMVREKALPREQWGLYSQGHCWIGADDPIAASNMPTPDLAMLLATVRALYRREKASDIRIRS